MILLSKFAFTAQDVWQMPLLELAAWIADYAEMNGVKSSQNRAMWRENQVREESFVFTRRGKMGA